MHSCQIYNIPVSAAHGSSAMLVSDQLCLQKTLHRKEYEKWVDKTEPET